VFLIGQLSKNDVYGKDIEGKEIVDHALSVITEAKERIGGRIVMIECNHEDKLVKFYEDNGFEVISRNPDEHIKMIRMLAEDD